MNKFIIVGLFALIMGSTGCNKDNTHTSLLGSWQCEEFPVQTAPSKYQVNIVRNNAIPNETNQYIIYNFFKLGFEEENSVSFVEDSIGKLTIIPISINGTQIHGTGIVASDYSRIDWEYTITKDFTEKVNATYY